MSLIDNFRQALTAEIEEQKNTSPDFEDTRMEHFIYGRILNRQPAQSSYIDTKFKQLTTAVRQLLFVR